MSIRVEKDGPITTVIVDRRAARTAVDPAMGQALADAFAAFDADDAARVGVFWGAHGSFCAGFDLKVAAARDAPTTRSEDGIGPMGPTRLLLQKPVIAAVSGHAVAGGAAPAPGGGFRRGGGGAAVGVFSPPRGGPPRAGGPGPRPPPTPPRPP